MPPGALRLVGVASKACDSFEIGRELDRPLDTHHLGNERVQPDLGGNRILAGLRVPIVDGDARHPAGTADAGEDRDVRLAPALDDR